jgi:hypothetical protein
VLALLLSPFSHFLCGVLLIRTHANRLQELGV